MKTAICYYGNLGGYAGKELRGGVIHPRECFASIHRHIVQPNGKVDIFVHSWSSDFEKEILGTLQPIRHQIEDQIDFSELAKAYVLPIRSISTLRERVSRCLQSAISQAKKDEYVNSVKRAYSRWYSTQKVLELKAAFERDRGFVYDHVMLLRFDTEFFTNLRFSDHCNKYFYSSYWSVPGRREKFDRERFQDYWFFSNSKNMDDFGSLFNYVQDYPADPHQASYQHARKFFGEDRIRYTLLLGRDYELMRRTRFGCIEQTTGGLRSTIKAVARKALDRCL